MTGGGLALPCQGPLVDRYRPMLLGAPPKSRQGLSLFPCTCSQRRKATLMVGPRLPASLRWSSFPLSKSLMLGPTWQPRKPPFLFWVADTRAPLVSATPLGSLAARPDRPVPAPAPEPSTLAPTRRSHAHSAPARSPPLVLISVVDPRTDDRGNRIPLRSLFLLKTHLVSENRSHRP